MQVLKTAVRQERERIQQGTIASACETGLGLQDFIKMARIAGESDPAAARFIDAWNALSTSEQQAPRAADALCKHLQISALELLRVVADAAYRFSIHTVHTIALLAYPQILEETIGLALNARNERTRLRAQTLVHEATSFVPMPNSQTAIAIPNTNFTADSGAGSAPRPEDTIKRLSQRLNAMRSSATPALPASRTAGSVARGYAVRKELAAPRRVAQAGYESKDEDDDL